MDHQDRGCNRVNVNLILRIRLRWTWSHVAALVRPIVTVASSCLLKNNDNSVHANWFINHAKMKYRQRGKKQRELRPASLHHSFFAEAADKLVHIQHCAKGLPRRNTSLPRVKTLRSLNTAEYFLVREKNCGWPTSRIWLSTKCEHWR